MTRPGDEKYSGISVIVPTFRERENITPLYEAIRESVSTSFPEFDWEILFVDDNSDDGTDDEVRRVARNDRRVRLIQRHNRRGLASAVVEGAFASTFDLAVVMDGDLQHDPKYIPALLQPILSGHADIVSASRFLEDDGASGLSSEARVKQSETGNSLIRRVFGIPLTDPLTGFFATKRDTITKTARNLSTMGFKILLDLIISSKPKPVVVEIPFQFAKRNAGESKLDTRVLYEFFLFILEKKVPGVRLLSPRFVSFGLVGGSGVVVHMIIMSLLIVLLTGSMMGPTDNGVFSMAQFGGGFVAMIWNYNVNNVLTFRDQRRTGRAFWTGMLLFIGLSAVGLVANVGVATAVNRSIDMNWSIAALAGIAMGTVWNYATTRGLIWRK